MNSCLMFGVNANIIHVLCEDYWSQAVARADCRKFSGGLGSCGVKQVHWFHKDSGRPWLDQVARSVLAA